MEDHIIKAVIIDDERVSRETLLVFLKNYCQNVEVVAEASSAEEGITIIKNYTIDLLFLDVEMPLGSGFDLLESLETVNFDIIFTTAHEKYAIRAIRFCALDYLLKPISVSELKQALKKIQDKKNVLGNSQIKAKFDVFLNNVKHLNSQHSKIILPTMEGFEVVEVKDIIRCEAQENYTLFYFSSKTKLMVSKTLKDYEELFSEFDFIRIHQSHLVNAMHILRYIKGSGGYVKMSDDSIIEVSRRKKEELMKRFQSN